MFRVKVQLSVTGYCLTYVRTCSACYILTKLLGLAVPGFEPGLPDSKSGVLTTTLYRRYGHLNDGRRQT